MLDKYKQIRRSTDNHFVYDEDFHSKKFVLETFLLNNNVCKL